MTRVFLTTTRYVRYDCGTPQLVGDTLLIIGSSSYGYSSNNTPPLATFNMSAICGFDDGLGMVEEPTTTAGMVETPP